MYGAFFICLAGLCGIGDIKKYIKGKQNLHDKQRTGKPSPAGSPPPSLCYTLRLWEYYAKFKGRILLFLL